MISSAGVKFAGPSSAFVDGPMNKFWYDFCFYSRSSLTTTKSDLENGLKWTFRLPKFACLWVIYQNSGTRRKLWPSSQKCQVTRRILRSWILFQSFFVIMLWHRFVNLTVL